MAIMPRLCQFFTKNADYILDGFNLDNVYRIIEPFAGAGDLVDWARRKGWAGAIERYDIDPEVGDNGVRDTLIDPPDYTGAFVLTNPPYMARNKSQEKAVYDKYETNDMYKCFLYSVMSAIGGIIIIPAGFFSSVRPVDTRCRAEFMSRFYIDEVRYFEEQVFPDTTTCVVAIRFTRSETPLRSQRVKWRRFPKGDTAEFTMKQPLWVVGSEVFDLRGDGSLTVSRHVYGGPNCGALTGITLRTIDCTNGGVLKHGQTVIPSKPSDRANATLRFNGKMFTEDEQRQLCDRFNALFQQLVDRHWGLFLPPYREFGRKRIPFQLAYQLIEHVGCA